MTTYELATLVSSVAIDLGLLGIVWYGIRTMNRATDEAAQERRARAQNLAKRIEDEADTTVTDRIAI